MRAWKRSSCSLGLLACCRPGAALVPPANGQARAHVPAVAPVSAGAGFIPSTRFAHVFWAADVERGMPHTTGQVVDGQGRLLRMRWYRNDEDAALAVDRCVLRWRTGLMVGWRCRCVWRLASTERATARVMQQG